jgi:hypothetical protein
MRDDGLPESPMERAKRRSREMVSVDGLVGITERVPIARTLTQAVFHKEDI